MNASILIIGTGAVTAVGLTAPQTCAAMRARISGFSDVIFLPPPSEPVIGAKVPAGRALKKNPSEWLVNLAARAIRECIERIPLNNGRCALLITLPESYRQHPAITGLAGKNFLRAVEARLQTRFHQSSTTLEDGNAGVIKGIALARNLLASDVDYCVVGGVDSLLNRGDIDRLNLASRLHDEKNPQGVIPGEAAGFILLSRNTGNSVASPLAQILGLGIGMEQDTVLGERYSTGVGLRKALEMVIKDSGCEERQVSFRVSDMNGERYRAWESLICSTRFYRTRRERLPVWYPACSIGDVGAAAGALTIIAAVVGIVRGYAPGPIGMCEASSDQGLRAACVLAPAPGMPIPPFRSIEG